MMVSKRWSMAILAGFVVFLAGEAQARTFSMVGSWREWCCSRVITPGGTFTGNYTPFMGSPMGANTGTQPNGLPEGQTALLGGGTITATGSSPASLTIPAQLIGGGAYTNRDTNNGPQFWYLGISNMFSNNSGMFSENGGHGSFGICHGGKACATPGGGSSPTTYNWRVSQVAGTNKFGGSMRQLGFSKGKAVFHDGNVSVNTDLFFGFDPKFKGASGRHATGSSTAISYPTPLMNTFVFTSGAGPPCNMTTMGTHTARSFGTLCSGGTPLLIVHTSGSSQVATAPPFSSQGTGFKWTTGMAKVSAAQISAPFSSQTVSLTGYDNRTALGKGNIQLVSPFVFVRVATATSFPRMMRLRMRIGQDAPIPALSPGGFAIGGAVMLLLAVGFVVRRRRL